MSAQTLQQTTPAIVIDECSSWIERILVRAAQAVADGRARRARRTQLRTLSGLSSARLRDIGLDDPQVQKELYGAYFDTGRERAEDLGARSRF